MYVPSEKDTPYDRLGGDAAVRKLAARFYDHMDADEPALAKLHRLDANGKVDAGTRERFALFLVEWLGGPTLYSPVHGHPRLRMRHARVKIDVAMRDAWLRCMNAAMNDVGVPKETRPWLAQRFAEVADFLRNTPE